MLSKTGALGRPFFASGEGQNRTVDTTIFSRVLCQLSYLAGGPQSSGPLGTRTPTELAGLFVSLGILPAPVEQSGVLVTLSR